MSIPSVLGVFAQYMRIGNSKIGKEN